VVPAEGADPQVVEGQAVVELQPLPGAPGGRQLDLPLKAAAPGLVGVGKPDVGVHAADGGVGATPAFTDHSSSHSVSFALPATARASCPDSLSPGDKLPARRSSARAASCSSRTRWW